MLDWPAKMKGSTAPVFTPHLPSAGPATALSRNEVQGSSRNDGAKTRWGRFRGRNTSDRASLLWRPQRDSKSNLAISQKPSGTRPWPVSP